MADEQRGSESPPEGCSNDSPDHRDRATPPIVITFEDGTISLGPTADATTGGDPNGMADREWASSLLADAVLDDLGIESDPRSRTLRLEAHSYALLKNRLTALAIPHDDRVLTLSSVGRGALESAYSLRSYQAEALEDWLATDRWAVGGDISHPRPGTGDGSSQPRAPAGVLELPTGSGKTVVAMKAIETLATPTLVVVPTIDLLEQWVAELETEFDVPVGRFGGGEQRREALTVSTYDSAYLRAEAVGDRFGFVVFDEVHHLGGEGYRQIARDLPAPARLGMTATFERPDDAHVVIEDLVGPVVHRLAPDDLAGEHLAPYDVKRLEVTLTPEERAAYEEAQGIFVDYLAHSNIRMQSGADYQELVKRSGSDPRARAALLARRRARGIMLGAAGKLERLGEILERHRGERTIVFTAHNDLAYEVGERFLMPVLTHQTSPAERREILERFRQGTYSRVATSNVLDEGVDVPDASVAVVLSGSGSEREFTQRLGRILRPKADDGRAILYEVVAAETGEESIADRRR